MRLEVDIAVRRGALELELAMAVERGETAVLVGPNGAGKTSSLHALAGLLRVDCGRIALGERVLDGGPDGAWVPPEARELGVLFQDHLLFPHLTALENVAYGLRSRGVPRRAARAEADAWLGRVGLAGQRDLRPRELSGGQAQRVALARALAPSPQALLLDEPLAAVDAQAKLDLRRDLREHLATFAGPRIIVVHDIADALALADRIHVLEAGRLVQSGAIDEIVGKPRSPYVADLVGVNRYVGTCRGGVVEVDGARLLVSTPLEGEVMVIVHPRAVALFRERPAGSPRNVWSAPIAAIEPMLDRVRA
ncbi:MAG: ABC transporter ATP-binding protein, partial [Planctomycetes bacterium]|nr:ABC transporter ATP-binding protein [Planctomycetota bacterium]